MAVPPSIRFQEFAVSGVNPVGQRHLTTHSSFIGALSTAAGSFLNFGQLNTTFNKETSPTKVAVAFADDFNDANEAIFNMRFWLPDITDFTQGTFHFNGFVSGVWLSGLAQESLKLTDASGQFIPTALPSGFNLRRQDGHPEISGISSDTEVSEFVYLSVGLDTDVTSTPFGGDGGGFAYRLTFDFR